ncbi:hypothetical protein DASC09_030590 [Saccharomycopsis crataegensis]|uniref:GDP/GTP exchange factor Sec2 N-terminal domain-containing protein n=1 Tax=Saccharomycopsis crataegensis TaxID=43959 RepID=A0AAV5QM59_9ASCO|nr:hypothetical protein DASC09_030590 [Saccharomycopsis crataegensis]
MAEIVPVETHLANDVLIQEISTLKEELQSQIQKATELVVYKENYEDLVLDYNDINKEYDSLIKSESLAKNELKMLRKETEELSSELFNEANRMVSIERKKSHKLHEVNKFLKNEANEQKDIIKMYEHQLQSLKNAVVDLEQENQIAKANYATMQLNFARSPADEVEEDDPEEVNDKWHHTSNYQNKKYLSNILYSPAIQAIRFDSKFYQSFIEYMFANQLLLQTRSQPDFKDTYFFKRMVIEDIDPTLNLETSPHLTFFQKKTLYHAFYNQSISIEPFSYPENKNVRMAKFKGMSDHQGILLSKKPCAMCGEDRDHTHEHARLYMLKTSSKSKSNNTSPRLSRMFYIGPVAEQSNFEYPICNYCATRARTVCDLLGFLATIKMGMYSVSKHDKSSSKRLYLELSRHRCKLFWARVGIIQRDSLLVENNSFSDKQLSFNHEFCQLENMDTTPAGFGHQNTDSPRCFSGKSSDASQSPNFMENPFGYTSSVTCSPMSSLGKTSPDLSSNGSIMEDFKMIKPDFDINYEKQERVFSNMSPSELEDAAPFSPQIITNKISIPMEAIDDERIASSADDPIAIGEELIGNLETIAKLNSDTFVSTASPRSSSVEHLPDPKSVLSEQEDLHDLEEISQVLDGDFNDQDVFKPIGEDDIKSQIDMGSPNVDHSENDLIKAGFLDIEL